MSHVQGGPTSAEGLIRLAPGQPGVAPTPLLHLSVRLAVAVVVVLGVFALGADGPQAAPGFSVRAYGAKGDGRADDTAAFAAAVRAATPSRGVVYVPIGTYRVAQVDLPSGVRLVGESRADSVVRATTQARTLLDGATTLVLSSGTTGVGVSNLTLLGMGGTNGTANEILIGFANAANVVVHGVNLDGAQGRAIFATGAGSVGGVYDDIRITDVHGSNGIYGVGLWFYHGPSGNRVSNLVVDTTDSAGVSLDAGSDVGTGAVVAGNTLTNVWINRAARQPHAAAFTLEGAQRNVITGFTVRDLHAQASVAIVVMQDQTGIPSTGNTFANGSVSDLGRSAITIQSASRNVFRDISVANVGRVTTAALVELTWTPIRGGAVGGPTADNTFERISLSQSTGDYRWGVVLNSTKVSIVRNHFVSIAWDKPKNGLTRIHGTQAPLTGPNANTGLAP